MEHPPKQGLKRKLFTSEISLKSSFNGTSTKTRIETNANYEDASESRSFNGTSTKTRIETRIILEVIRENAIGFNGTSTKTRIETTLLLFLHSHLHQVLMEHPPKQGLKHFALNCLHLSFFVLMEHPPKQGLKQ